MRGKDLVSVSDFRPGELKRVLDLAIRLKRQNRRHGAPLGGQVLALVFQKPSLRTRVSFEVAMLQLGGQAMYLSNQEIRLGERESVPDVARVLSRMVDGVVARTFFHRHVQELAEAADVPVINGLSDQEHPCQIVADLLTMLEHSGKLAGLKLAWVGDGNNVANSLLLAAPMVGLNLMIATPAGYEPDQKLLARASDAAESADVQLEVTGDPLAAVRDADYIYTDTWYSMGQEDEREIRRARFRDYQVNQDLLRAAGGRARVLHCLPAHRGDEITDEVLDGPCSVTLDQAENRLHAQKAILLELLRPDVGDA